MGKHGSLNFFIFFSLSSPGFYWWKHTNIQKIFYSCIFFLINIVPSFFFSCKIFLRSIDKFKCQFHNGTKLMLLNSNGIYTSADERFFPRHNKEMGIFFFQFAFGNAIKTAISNLIYGKLSIANYYTSESMCPDRIYHLIVDQSIE